MPIFIPILCHWLLALLFAPLLPGVIARVKAVMTGRRGPSVFQPYYDLIKLFRKKCVYSRTTSWVFRMAPLVVFGSLLMVMLIIPLGALKAPLQFAGDIFLVAYLLALARFFTITSALETGSSFEGMGASREAFFSCLSEISLFMNFVTLTILAHSMSLSQMIGAEIPVSWHLIGPALLLVTASLFIVLLVENCRIPFDDPDTHQELTMIHEVMILDHSGVDLAHMIYGAAVKLLFLTGILVPIFFPVPAGHPVKEMLVFAGGALLVAVAVALVESSMARVRLSRAKNLLFVAFALGFFGFIVTLWRAGL